MRKFEIMQTKRIKKANQSYEVRIEQEYGFKFRTFRIKKENNTWSLYYNGQLEMTYSKYKDALHDAVVIARKDIMKEMAVKGELQYFI